MTTTPTKWAKGLAEWTEGDTAYLSVAFSWLIDEAYARAVWFRAAGYRVRVGGPGVFLRGHSLADVAEIGGSIRDAVIRHNPQATFASRGCDVGCWFCVVPKMEGRAFTALPDFTPRPILCDSNLSGLPASYQDHIVRRYIAAGVPLLDAQSGFEPGSFNGETYERWARINRGPWRIAYDDTAERDAVCRTMALLRSRGAKPRRLPVYVLLGNEPMDACLGRLRDVIQWGGEPHAQPFIKLNAERKEPHVRHDWTRRALVTMARWANRRVWRYADFGDYTRATPAPEGIGDLLATGGLA